LHHAGREVPAWDGSGSGLAAAVRVSYVEDENRKIVDSFLSPSRSSSAMRSPWI